MSVAVSSTHSYADRLGPPTKTPTVRKGGPLPLLLDAFPVPPNHTPTPSPSTSSPSHRFFPIASTSSSSSSNSVSASSSATVILPVPRQPPRGPLPPVPRSASESAVRTLKKMNHTTSMEQRSPTTANPRSVSPDITSLIDTNSVKKSSLRRRKPLSDKDIARGSVSSHGSGSISINSEDGEDSGHESGGSESSIDIHTPLPHLMVREGLLSPNSKAVASLSRTASPAMSRVSLVSMDSNVTSFEEREKRKLRHRNNKVLREGLGLTTGLGWSDSEDENDESRFALINRLSKSSSSSSLRSKAYPTSIRSAPPSSAHFAASSGSYAPRRCSTLSQSTSSSHSTSTNTTSYSAFSVQKPTSIFSRSQSDSVISHASTGSDGSSNTASSLSSRKSKSRLVTPSRPRLASIGEAEKPLTVEDLGPSSTNPADIDDAYGQSGYNFSLPRSVSRNSMTSPTLSNNSPTTPSPSPLSPKLKPASIPPKLATVPASIPKPPSRPPAPSKPKFRYNMDARVKRLEDKMAELQNYAPPPLEGDSDTEKDERSRTPTPQSPGEELSTDSAGSAGPLTPSDSRTSYERRSKKKEGDAMQSSSSEGSLTAAAAADGATRVGGISSAPATISQHPPKSSLTRSPSKIRPLITASASYAYSQPKSASASLENNDNVIYRSGPSTGSLTHATSSPALALPRSLSSPRTPPTRPAPPANSALPPTSVEYASRSSSSHHQLHPLTARSGIAVARSPARVSSLHPLNQGSGGSASSPSSPKTPSLLAYSPPGEVGLSSFSARTGTGMVYRRADNKDPVASGSVGRLGVGKLTPKKALPPHSSISGVLGSAGGIGAGGVGRV